MIYENLIFQTNIWNKLVSYNVANRLPSALLLYGNNGVGKEAHAIEFATLINCTEGTDLESCGSCNSCCKMKTFQHGNLKLINPMPRKKTTKSSESPLYSLSKSELEDYNNQLKLKGKDPYYKIKIPRANSILINSIRYLKKELTLSSIESGWNVILITEAEKLCYPNNVSANSLLKILEEPPEKTLFILTTSNYSQIIETIKSRCQTLFFPPIALDQIYNSIDKSTPDNDKYVIANIANGSMDLAKKLEDNLEELYNNLKLFINCCYGVDSKYNNKMNDKISNIYRRNNKAEDLMIFFRSTMTYFKDLLIFSKTNNTNNIVYKNLEEHYNKITNYNNNTNWDLCITIIENTCNYLDRNAYPPLAINGMLIELKNIINNKPNANFNINDWLGTQ